MSRAKEWQEIKDGTRRVRRVCNRMLPQRRGVACMTKLNNFEADLNRIVKKPDIYYRKRRN